MDIYYIMVAHNCHFLQRKALDFGATNQYDIVCTISAFLDGKWPRNFKTKVGGVAHANACTVHKIEHSIEQTKCYDEFPNVSEI